MCYRRKQTAAELNATDRIPDTVGVRAGRSYTSMGDDCGALKPRLIEIHSSLLEYLDYDDYWKWTNADINFLHHCFRDVGGPILELACGTGRVAVPLAETGHEIHGLDASLGISKCHLRATVKSRFGLSRNKFEMITDTELARRR